MIDIYNLALFFYYSAINLAALVGNTKAKQWIDGRKNLVLPKFEKPVIWFHCASLGEYEQGKPLIEHFSKTYKKSFILLLTFYSPSRL